jgi:predicted enzyme related to lactoylglutathione lyase
MRVTKFELNLPTEDLKRCLEFYVDGLLFTKVFEFSQSCTISLDSFYLTFHVAHPQTVKALRHGFSCCIRVDEIQSYFDRVKSSGRVMFEQELELMQPGVWQFSLVDCNGYRVGFAMP